MGDVLCVSSFISSASFIISISWSDPMFITCPFASFLVIRSRCASMLSVTYRNERVCLPSPCTVMGSPLRACVMNFVITLPYEGMDMSRRGPYVLNILEIRTSRPYSL